MTTLQLTAIAALLVPTLVIVLWPLLSGVRRETPGPPADRGQERRRELLEEKATIYRALKELDFDHEAGHLSDDDHRSLRDRYETRAAAMLTELDALPRETSRAGRPPLGERGGHVEARASGSWTRHPITLGAGALLLLVFGVIIGVNAGRFSERDQMGTPPESRLPVPAPQAGASVGPPTVSLEPGKSIPPEMLAGMLRAARESLFDGRYPEAIAAYQAVLKRDPKNVDAMTHLGLIVAIGGHADAALETFDKVVAIDPKYAPTYLYRGQVLYEQKQDYPGAVKAWERFLALVPSGEDHNRVAALLEEARSKQRVR